MERIRIQGGVPIAGTVRIGGAKNAALPLMAASLLSDKALRLSNLPHLADISTLARLLARLGVEIRMEGADSADGHAGRVLDLRAARILSTEAPYDLVRKMRASILVLGPLVARASAATVSLPGGCAIGSRPVDLHLMGLEALGAKIELREGYVRARAPRGLKGADITFPSVSVGASENVLMAACLARGESVLRNLAVEPEVVDLARCLVAMGARIEGIGTRTMRVHGVAALGGANYAIVPDRIETGTYATAAAITGGEIHILGSRLDLIAAVAETLGAAGVAITENGAGIRVARGANAVRAVDVATAPYPGFPTDMQAQLMALLATATGTSTVTEEVFENRFMHVPELGRMGAKITLEGPSAVIRGVSRLKGAEVMATDLRASVSLVLAGLAAEGETTVSRVYHLDRGYEHLVEKLAACGAAIERVPA